MFAVRHDFGEDCGCGQCVSRVGAQIQAGKRSAQVMFPFHHLLIHAAISARPRPQKREHAQVSGSTTKSVDCVFCCHKYAYSMNRVARATGASIVEADQQAWDRLRRVLAKEIDPVPCPRCGSFQPAMIRLLKWRHLARLRFDGIALIGLGLGFSAFLSAYDVTLAWLVLVAMGSIGVGLILLRSVLAWRYDPNACHNGEAREMAARLNAEATINPITAVFLVLLGTVIGVPAFLLMAGVLGDRISYMRRVEPGTAVMAREWTSVFGGLPRIELRYQRLGRLYVKEVRFDRRGHSDPDRYQIGETVPILFDPQRDDFVEGSKESLYFDVAWLILANLSSAGLLCAGYYGWRQAVRHARNCEGINMPEPVPSVKPAAEQ
jgi:hypothetical protein